MNYALTARKSVAKTHLVARAFCATETFGLSLATVALI